MHIFLSADHGGFALKEQVIDHLRQLGHEVTDCGVYTDEERVDFPDYVTKVARGVVEEGGMGIMICGTGIGICIAANKLPGIRAALCSNPYDAQYARRDDDANVLCLGGRTMGTALALATVDAFLDTSFAGGHYQARVDKITLLEANGFDYGN